MYVSQQIVFEIPKIRVGILFGTQIWIVFTKETGNIIMQIICDTEQVNWNENYIDKLLFYPILMAQLGTQ